MGGEIETPFPNRVSISPPVGKLSPDSKNGFQFSHGHGLWYLIPDFVTTLEGTDLKSRQESEDSCDVSSLFEILSSDLNIKYL